jgi:hypothetical protein
MTPMANRLKTEPYPPIDYMHGQHKPRVVGPMLDGGFHVEIITTWPNINLTNWTSCPHVHRTERAAERCMWAWNDYAHDQREAILREGNGG